MIYNQNGITITEAKQEDVISLVPRLRIDDVVEIEALGVTPLFALSASYRDSSRAYTVKIEGNPIAMFGLTSVNSEEALIWMVGTDELYTIQRRFLRNSREFIAEALEMYETVYNFVDTRNEASIKWLQWLGARIEEPKEYGINGELFHRFSFSQAKEVIPSLNSMAEVAPREKIALMEKALLNHPNAIMAQDENAPKLKHDFTDGIYTRTIFLPKGMILTGKIHRHDHPNFLMEGKVEVYTEQNGVEVLKAPQVIMSKAGTKRVVLTLENTTWATVHLNPSNTRDLDELEDNIIAPAYDQLENKVQEVLR